MNKHVPSGLPDRDEHNRSWLGDCSLRQLNSSPLRRKFTLLLKALLKSVLWGETREFLQWGWQQLGLLRAVWDVSAPPGCCQHLHMPMGTPSTSATRGSLHCAMAPRPVYLGDPLEKKKRNNNNKTTILQVHPFTSRNHRGVIKTWW